MFPASLQYPRARFPDREAWRIAAEVTKDDVTSVGIRAPGATALRPSLA